MAQLPPTDAERIDRIEADLRAVAERTEEQDKILSTLYRLNRGNRRSIDRTASAFIAFCALLVILTLSGLRLQGGEISYGLSDEVLIGLVSALGAGLAAFGPTIASVVERLFGIKEE